MKCRPLRGRRPSCRTHRNALAQLDRPDFPFDPAYLAQGTARAESLQPHSGGRRHAGQSGAVVAPARTLLLNILPATIVQRINRGEVAIADRFPEATILFSDLVGFTSLAGRSSPGRSSDPQPPVFLVRCARQTTGARENQDDRRCLYGGRWIAGATARSRRSGCRHGD